MARLIFKLNANDKNMYDMIYKWKNKKGEENQMVVAAVHVDSIGDMGADNYIRGSKDQAGYYKQEVTAEILF